MGVLEVVADRLGLAELERGSFAQLSRLAELAHQVCGYDTTPKQLWALAGRVGDPPGLDMESYWEGWLRDGSAGTCYATTNAIGALAAHLGFDCWMAGWRMVGDQDGVGVHHAANVVVVNGIRYLLETSSSVPVPLRWPGEGEASSDPTRTTTLSCVAGRLQMHVPRAGTNGIKIYELVQECVTAEELLGHYRDTVGIHPEAQSRFFVTRTLPSGVTHALFEGHLLVRRGNIVLHEGDVTAEDAVRFLARFGFSRAWVARLRDAGAFAFESRRT